MRNIDFRTSHNIVLSYPLAGPRQRIIAYAIDLIFVWVLFAFSTSLLGSNLAVLYVLSTFYFFLYHITFEVFKMGQSPGKMLLKIRVVSLDGKTPSLKQYIIRWSYRMIDILLTLGSLGTFAVISSPRGQRIGDLLAGTTVVNTSHQMFNNLEDLEKLNNTKRDIKYPNIVHYNDEEMLTVKAMLQRYRSFPNDDNADLIQDLASKIAKDLSIPHIKGSKVDFLETVLSDYIVLTR
jgi:uncharacterized RDD family membrane protein YckC